MIFALLGIVRRIGIFRIKVCRRSQSSVVHRAAAHGQWRETHPEERVVRFERVAQPESSVLCTREGLDQYWNSVEQVASTHSTWQARLVLRAKGDGNDKSFRDFFPGREVLIHSTLFDPSHVRTDEKIDHGLCTGLANPIRPSNLVAVASRSLTSVISGVRVDRATLFRNLAVALRSGTSIIAVGRDADRTDRPQVAHHLYLHSPGSRRPSTDRAGCAREAVRAQVEPRVLEKELREGRRHRPVSRMQQPTFDR